MSLSFQTLVLAFLALTLSDSEAPAQDRDSGANPKARVPPQLPPVPPIPPSPIDYFRKLIDATPAEREKLLEGKSPEHRRVLTNNLLSYLALSPADRDLRLRAMELRYHIPSLLQVPASNRAERLALVPEIHRNFVQERLTNFWDRLTPEARRQLLESPPTLRTAPFLPPMPPMPPAPAPRSAARGSNTHSQAVAERALTLWRNYPEARRREIVAVFTNFLDQPQPRQQKTLAPLSAVEREQMEKTLEVYRGMPHLQRSTAVNAFDKFAGLSPDERRQFLRNAEAWQSISPADRERWRRIVRTLPPMPPMPPGYGMPPAPPMPPTPSASGRTSLVASNAP